MKRFLFSVLCCLVLATAGAETLLAQTTTFVSPTPLYRFRVSNTNLGYLYTTSFAEGVNAGYTPDGAQHNANGILGFIVVPPTQDSTPVAGQGLQTLHRWRVVQGNRLYWYVTPFPSTHGSGYTYEGIMGYTFSLNDPRVGFTLTAWYSQDFGYFFGINGEKPPDASPELSPFLPPPEPCEFTHINPATGLYYCSSYSNHGNICKLLPNNFGTFQFTTPLPPPPPPPSSCNVSTAIKAKCSQLGGSWSDETCTCEY